MVEIKQKQTKQLTFSWNYLKELSNLKWSRNLYGEYWVFNLITQMPIIICKVKANECFTNNCTNANKI